MGANDDKQVLKESRDHVCGFIQSCPLVKMDRCINVEARNPQACVEYWKHSKSKDFEDLVESWR